MANRASLIAASPRTLKGAAALGVIQAIGWAVVTLAASGSSTLPNSPFPRAAGLALGVAILAPLSALPVAVALSRYPRRRYREALIFQAALLLIFADGFVGHPSLVDALFVLWPIAVIALLASPSAQQFIADREARFTAIQG